MGQFHLEYREYNLGVHIIFFIKKKKKESTFFSEILKKNLMSNPFFIN